MNLDKNDDTKKAHLPSKNVVEAKDINLVSFKTRIENSMMIDACNTHSFKDSVMDCFDQNKLNELSLKQLNDARFPSDDSHMYGEGKNTENYSINPSNMCTRSKINNTTCTMPNESGKRSADDVSKVGEIMTIDCKNDNDSWVFNTIKKQLSIRHHDQPTSLILVGCILRAKDLLESNSTDNNSVGTSTSSTEYAAEPDQARFLIKVSYFQAAASKRVIPILRSRKIIHETHVQSSVNPEWNSSFLAHLPKRTDGFVRCVQFSVYCINDETRQRIFVGQNCVKINNDEPTGRGLTRWLQLYKWDGTTQVQGEILVTTEVFWPKLNLHRDHT